MLPSALSKASSIIGTCTRFESPCSPNNCLNDAATLQQIGRIRDLGVRTYVLGLPGVENFSYVLDRMAEVGGTARAGSPRYYEANDPAALSDALASITEQLASCRFGVTGITLAAADTITVSVGANVVSRDVLRTNGWDVVATNTIELFGASCDLASDSGATITVRACNTP